MANQKNIQPISVPMESKLSLAEIDDLVHSVENPSFAEKNSLTYQGIISNAHVTQGNGFITTHGKPLVTSQLYGDDGLTPIGTRLTDENGKKYDVKHEWILKDSYQIKNYTGGIIASASVYKNNLFVLFNDEGSWAFVVADANTKKLKNLYQLDGLDTGVGVINKCNGAIIGSVYGNIDQAPTLWILANQKEDPAGWENDIFEIELSNFGRKELHKTDLSFPLGTKMTATDVTGYGEGKSVGFEDLDQGRRGTFRKRNGEFKFIPYFGTVSPSGMLTGEPEPIVGEITSGNSFNKLPIEVRRADNGTLIWFIKDAVKKYRGSNQLVLSLQIGYDAADRSMAGILSKVSKDYDIWISDNISVNDIDSEGETDNPKEYFITNFADSKGVYYDWGQGWSKTYYRVATTSFRDAAVKEMAILTLGATDTSSDNKGSISLFRIETLMAKGKYKYFSYTPEHLNERIYTVGGDNKGENSILDKIPFSVDLLYQGYQAPDSKNRLNILKRQVFGLTETSCSFKQTLLTTPSAGNQRPASLNVIWNDSSLNLFDNGEIYQIIKSSDVKDFKMTKIADYSFKLNVLDNKNLIREDRDGNISLMKSFVPYNMECVLDIGGLKLDAPISPNGVGALQPGQEGWDAKIQELYEGMSKEITDTWYEGAGVNVNLDVENPSMSFLLPKIILPLWIAKKDRVAFKNEAIDRRKSILKPVLRGALLDDESIDVYYTLSTDSQDCSYKATQILKTGIEYEKDGWDIFGKSTYDVLKKGMTWWMDEANTVIFPIGIGSTISGINFITPSVQLPQGYSSRLYTQYNRLFMGFNYTSQIWHGSTIFTIYGSNYYYDGQGIYFVGSDQDFSNNNFVTYALGMEFLANSGSEAYFYSDFEKRLYVFTGSNTLQAADKLSSLKGTIIDAVYSSKEQALYMLTSTGRILVRTQTDLCELKYTDYKQGHLEGTTEGAALVDGYNYKIFSPWKGVDVLPFALRTEHFGSPDWVSKLAYADILLYKNEDETPTVTITCQTLNGIERKSEKVNIKVNKQNWRGNTYRLRFTPKLNVGNAFDLGIYSMDKIGVQSVCFYMEGISMGLGDPWQNNVVNEQQSLSLESKPVGGIKVTPGISVF